jgi:beta-galactosidase/beta-glucuronidase
MVRLGRAMLLQVLLMLSATAAPPQEFTRRALALDGDWEFALDPQRAGIAKGWHTGLHPLPHRCPVPGAWEAAGFGNATDRIWHSYTPTRQRDHGRAVSHRSRPKYVDGRPRLVPQEYLAAASG